MENCGPRKQTRVVNERRTRSVDAVVFVSRARQTGVMVGGGPWPDDILRRLSFALYTCVDGKGKRFRERCISASSVLTHDLTKHVTVFVTLKSVLKVLLVD